jgi:hypothetical protein
MFFLYSTYINNLLIGIAKTTRTRNVLYSAPTIMLSTFLAAVSLAVGYHVFNLYWNGRKVQSKLQQEINTAIGTAFAFLVEAAMSAAVGTAYTQIVWSIFLKDRLQVRTIDWLSGLLSSALSLLNWREVRKHPAHASLAMVFFALPFATIFTPGTLYVNLAYKPSSNTTMVPNLDLYRGNATNSYSTAWNGRRPFWFPHSATLPLELMAAALAATDYWPTLPIFALNASYSVVFDGPWLSCSTTSVENFAGGCLTCLTGSPSGLNPFGYLAWIPSAMNGTTDFTEIKSVAPFPWLSNGTSTVDCNNFGYQSGGNLEYDQDATPRLFVALQTDNTSTSLPCGNWTIVQCETSTASIQADFAVNDSIQTVVLEKLSAKPMSTRNEDADGNPAGNSLLNYTVMWDLVGQLTFGLVDVAESWGPSLNTEGGVPMNIFGSAAALGSNEMFSFYNSLPPNSDLNGTGNFTGSWGWIAEQWILDADFVQGVPTFPALGNGKSLASVLEETFRNWTIGMFSIESMLRMDPVNVTYTTPKTIYVYSALHLWLSYGVGLFVTAAIVTFSCYTAISKNKASYQSRFSTYLRVTPWESIEIEEEEGQLLGADPVSEELGNTYIRLGQMWPSYT